ncbi:type II secretion system protein GspJ [Shimia sp. MIT1388]|uniref:type II secretion system protein GspJ n=1 Tax=Shimia sp. MIT1388 TaxID=3096992 RepID=UPI00399C3F47
MRSAQRENFPKSDQGLSLIELVVALALFALVAVMGTQGLTGMMRLRDGLTERSEAAAALEQVTSLLRNDLSSAVPMPFFSPDNGPIRSAIAEESQGFSLSIGGQSVLRPETQPQPVLNRVEWRFGLSSGHILRRRWATLTPLNASALGPEVVIMEGVREIRLRSYWGELGWVDGLRLPIAAVKEPGALDADGGPVATTAFSSDLPDGVEITLVTEAHGEIVIVEALK